MSTARSASPFKVFGATTLSAMLLLAAPVALRSCSCQSLPAVSSRAQAVKQRNFIEQSPNMPAFIDARMTGGHFTNGASMRM